MRYPFFLQQQSLQPFPLFGNALQGEPLYLDMSDQNRDLLTVNVADQEAYFAYMQGKMGERYQWVISDYLEYRSTLLAHYPHMAQEKRFFHLGIDITVAAGTSLYSPLNATVQNSGYEIGKGTYGGYILLKHTGNFETFYSFYGHMNPSTVPAIGSALQRGQKLGELGDMNNNGYWFPHLHLQILTERAFSEGYISKGYCTAEQLSEIPLLCPHPGFLFHF